MNNATGTMLEPGKPAALLGQRVAFTGRFASLTRSQAEKLVGDALGRLSPSVSSRATMLVVMARVFFTLLGERPKIEETTRALQHAAGFLRSCLATRFAMRSVPQLRFVHDPSVERGMQLSQLIDSARADDARRAKRGKRTR